MHSSLVSAHNASSLIETNYTIFIYEFKEYLAQVTLRTGSIYPVKFKIKFNEECETIGTCGCSGDNKYTYYCKGKDVTNEEPRYIANDLGLRNCYQEYGEYWKSKGVNDITFTITISTVGDCEVQPPICSHTKNENIPLEVKNMAGAVLEKLNEFYTKNPKLW